MMSCQDFRAGFSTATSDPRLLEHVRSCDACLAYAAGIDPDIVFRAIGGGELVPPGGIDAFVDDVMRQVRVRSAAKIVSVRSRWSSWQKWSAAAALAFGVTGAALVYQHGHKATPVAPVPHAVAATNLTTRAVVETYESENATIVEVPPATADGAQVVMIFDDSLPSDL